MHGGVIEVLRSALCVFLYEILQLLYFSNAIVSCKSTFNSLAANQVANALARQSGSMSNLYVWWDIPCQTITALLTSDSV